MPVESVLPIVIGISLLALGVAWLLAREVLAADTGKPEMRAISDAIREGAEAFLSRQYRTIGAAVASSPPRRSSASTSSTATSRTSRRWARAPSGRSRSRS